MGKELRGLSERFLQTWSGNAKVTFHQVCPQLCALEEKEMELVKYQSFCQNLIALNFDSLKKD